MLEPTALTFEKSGPRPTALDTVTSLPGPPGFIPAENHAPLCPLRPKCRRLLSVRAPSLAAPAFPGENSWAGACVPIAKAGESLLVPRLRRLDLLFGDDRASFPSFPSTIVVSINIVLCLSHDNGTQDSVIPS